MYLEFILPALFALWIACFFLCEIRASRQEAREKQRRDDARTARLRQFQRQ